MALQPEEVDYAKQHQPKQYIKLAALSPGESLTLRLVDVTKNEQTKFPIPGERFNYRFHTEQGALLDLASKWMAGQLIAWMCPSGAALVPITVKITHKTSLKPKESKYGLELITQE